MDRILMIVHKQVIALIKQMVKVKQRFNEIFILCLVKSEERTQTGCLGLCCGFWVMISIRFIVELIFFFAFSVQPFLIRLVT